MISLRGDSDPNVDSTMAAVHGQLLVLRSSIEVVRARTHFPLTRDYWSQIRVLLTHPPALALHPGLSLFQ